MIIRLGPGILVTRRSPLFGSGRAPAACWWARAIVESTDTIQSTSPGSLRLALQPCRTVSHVPSCDHG